MTQTRIRVLTPEALDAAAANLVNTNGSALGTAVATKAGSSTPTVSGVSSPTANSLMQRDAAGRSQVATPSAAGDISTKGYVDTAVTPLTTATYNNTASTLVSRDASGNTTLNQLTLSSATPQTSSQATRKDYVDAQVLAALQLANNAQTASYTLVAADAGELVTLTAAAGVSLTVPTNTSVPFPIGTVINVLQGGAGQISVAAASGVGITAPGGWATSRQGARIQLIKTALDGWWLTGDVATASITSTTRPASPAVGVKYTETDTGDIVAYNGTRWTKVGGAPRVILEVPNGASSSSLINGGGDLPALTYTTPNHTAGLLRFRWSGEWNANANAAVMLSLRYVTFASVVPGGSSRGHNHGGTATTVVPFHLPGTFNSDGTSQSVWISANVDSGGAPMYVLENSLTVWLEALPS